MSWTWANQAACKGLTTLMAMPPAGASRPHEILRAKEVCDRCPVFADCLEWVIGQTPDPTPQMITAGMTLDERRALRRDLGVRRMTG